LTVYFFDSSALVKRYVAETGTPWVQAVTTPLAQNTVVIARITWVEVLSAFARRQRLGDLSSDRVARVVDSFHYDLDVQYQVIELNDIVAENAGELIRRHPLRAYDAVQLASALRMRPAFAQAEPGSLTFVTADVRLGTVAQAEGMQVDNPNLHA
jgi:predicted nucleic acid-binding protein